MSKPKLIRMTTKPLSMVGLLTGQIRFMSEHFDILAVSSNEENRLEILEKEEGVRTFPVHMTRQITPLDDIKAVWKLYRLFKREKPFIVHTHTPKAGTLGMFAAYLAGVPHRLHTVAGMPLLVQVGFKRRLLDLVEKITYACATKVYPNSFGLEDIIKKEYTKPEKVKVLGNGSSNGIDTKHFDYNLYSPSSNLEFRQSLGIQKEDFVFLFVGRLVKDKGINELIEAFKALENTGLKNCKLLLVGHFETQLDPLLPETIVEIEANPNIIFTGWQGDVRPYFAASNVFVFPSYREGFPNVVMQAGAMGVPSIATNINGCNEIIIEGENGTLVPTKSSTELFNKMNTYYHNLETNQNLKFDSEAIRDLILKRYDRKKIWEVILEEYKTLKD